MKSRTRGTEPLTPLLGVGCARGSSLPAYRVHATHTLSPFLPSLVPSYLPRCRPRGGRRGGGTLCGSAWSETSFPFHLMLPRGPKEAYLRARARAPPPLSSLASQTAGGRGGRHSNRPADRRFGGRGRGRANCAGSCPRAGGREGGREGARSVSQNFCYRRLFSPALQIRLLLLSSVLPSLPPFVPVPCRRRVHPPGISSRRRRGRHSIPFHSNV